MSPHAPSVETILAEAVDIPDPADRAAYLDRACDPALRGRVERLVADHFRAGSFLEHPAVGTPDETVSFAPASGEDEGPGAVIGPYKLLERIGEGGMGAVYVAEQHHPVRRKVALKVIKPGMDSGQVVARFEQERQALALMDHPHIARVLDGGATATGRPYFVMELVRGLPVTDYCDQAKLPIPDRLKLFADVCRAVQHAHQKGVIHRDLKPSNVLVTVIDGRPVPKVIDFGIAKATGAALTDRTLHTGFHQLVGTPLYMAPEQAELSGVDVDTRADVYSLGVLLYELLTGTTPFDPDTLRKAGFDEMRRIIREDEPAKPSRRVDTLAAGRSATVATGRGVDPRRLGRLIRGELDWVVMRCLDKDRNRRYQSPADLAADVQRYLAGAAVEAHPPSVGYRVRKVVRRNRGGLVVAGLVAGLVAAAGWSAADWGGRRVATHRVVEEALAEADDHQQRGKYPEALDAARRAEGLAAGGSAGRELRDRAAGRRADLELVLRLDEVRLERATTTTDGVFNWELNNRRYAEEFRAAGIDVNVLTDEAAADRLRNTTVATELAAAVDSWASDRRKARGDGDTGWQHLLAVARLADPDPWRYRLREALANRDKRALEELAGSGDVEGLPPMSVAILAGVLYHEGASGRGIALLRQAQRRHPTDFWINFNLGVSLGQSAPTEGEDAVRFSTVAVALRPWSPAPHAVLGFNLRRRGRLDEAILSYKEALRLNPGSHQEHNNLGVALRAKGEFDAALAAHREAIHLQPDYAVAHNALGTTLVRKNQFDEAIVSYQEAVRLQPDYHDARRNLGLALKAKSRWDEAIASFREAIRLQPDYHEAHTDLGSVQVQLGRLDEAADSFRQAIRIKPEYVDAHIHLGALLCDKKRNFDGAVIAFREALRIQPDHPAAHFNLGIAQRNLGRWDEAIASFGETVRIQPDHARAHFYLGTVLTTKGRADEAVTAYEKAVRLKPDYAEAHTNLGSVLLKQDRTDAAIASYNEAVRLRPDKAGYHLNLSNALKRKGRLADAVASLREAIRLQPDYAEAHLNLASALHNQGRADEAVAAGKEAIRLQPGNADAHSMLGSVLLDIGKLDAAAASLKEAVRLKPDLASAHYNLGTALLRLGQTDKAIAALNEAIRLRPDHAESHANLGRVLRDRGDLDWAIAAYNEALRLNPNLLPPTANLAWLLADAPEPKYRDVPRAVGLAKRAVKLAPAEGLCWLALGLAQYRAGEWEAAVAALNKSSGLRKGATAHDGYLLAMAHWQLGEKDKAREWYDKAVAWMEKNKPQDEELKRFRAEAAELLGIPPQESLPAPRPAK